MLIQINSDKQVVVDAELTASVEGEINRALARFESKLTRIEVHLSDLNGSKPGTKDKRCLIEARPTGENPVTASDEADTTEQAVRGAANKMNRLLESAFGRARDKAS